jgi:hypothetical protein
MLATKTAVNEFRSALIRNGTMQEQLRANRLLKRITTIADDPSALYRGISPSNKIGANDLLIFGTGDKLGIPTVSNDKRFAKTFFNRTGVPVNIIWVAPY